MTPIGSAALHGGVIAALRDVAGESIVPRFNKLRKEDVRTKTSPTDLVTIADEEAEQRLTPILHKLLPGSRIVGEEGFAADPNVIAALAGDDPVWVIDPIDGTTNFVNGTARFGVIIALVKRGETVMGWIHEPMLGKTLAAEKGSGVWEITIAGEVAERRIAPAAMPLKEMVVALHPKAFAHARGKFARNVWLGSAAHDYWSLADGRMQVLAYRKLKPWDHAAGVLIHAEAGGYNRLLDGAPYRPAVPDQEWLLCAPNEAVWAEVAALAER